MPKGFKGFQKGFPHSEEHRMNLSISLRGRKLSEEQKKSIKENNAKYWLGRKRPEVKNWLSGNKFFAGRKHTEEAKKKISESHSGKNHYAWIEDREILKRNKRNDPEYKQFVKKVKYRDKNICKLKSNDCSEYNIVHHIKGWSMFPELRYKVSNGITLCQAHHPRTRAKEKTLEPLFMALIVNNA